MRNILDFIVQALLGRAHDNSSYYDIYNDEESINYRYQGKFYHLNISDIVQELEARGFSKYVMDNDLKQDSAENILYNSYYFLKKILKGEE